MTDDVQDGWFFVSNEMFEMLLCGYLAFDCDLWFIGVLNVYFGTLRALYNLCNSDLKSTGILAYLCFF